MAGLACGGMETSGGGPGELQLQPAPATTPTRARAPRPAASGWTSNSSGSSSSGSGRDISPPFSSAATAPRGSPPPRARRDDCSAQMRLQLRSDQLAFAVFTVGQCLLWASVLARAETVAAKLQPALVAILTGLGLAASTWAPLRPFYLRHRTWLLPCLRLVVLLVPSARATKVGSSWILEREPRVGRFGALVDVVRLSYGNRVILILAQALVQVLPPLPALLTQAAAAMLTANSQAYCRTALLSHPTTWRRLADAAATLEAGSTLPMALVTPLSGQLVLQPRILAGEAPEEPVCRAVLTFFHVVGGVLLPFLAACWSYDKRPAGGADTAAASPPPTAGVQPPEAGRKRLLARLAGGTAAAVAAANSAAHDLLSHERWWWGAWWLLALTWVCSKNAAGL